MTHVTARRAATRERLIDAAIDVFAEKGVLGASVEEICEAAGFTRGAFYSNFDDKDDLCVAMLQRLHDDEGSALQDAVTSVGDVADDADLDTLLLAAIELFYASRWDDPKRVLTGQELRLHAARSPKMAQAYRDFHARTTHGVATMLETALSARGYELGTNGPVAMSVLHAVYDYGALGALIGSDTIACSASTRPRIAGSASTCTIDVDAVMKPMLAAPNTTPTGKANQRFGAMASTSIATPNTAADTTTSWIDTARRRAV